MAKDKASPDELLAVVTEYYLGSHDFNGISARDLAKVAGVPWPSLHSSTATLIRAGKVGVLFVTTNVNPHIIRIGFAPEEEQVRQLATSDLHHTCIYPRPLHLKEVVDRTQYTTEPYRLCLALGEAQLAFRVFDLSVLEAYRNDPRYHYLTSDIGGKICIKDEAYESAEFPEGDKVLLESFGFAYDADFNRAVAAYLRYLSNLTPEHQQIWKARELKGDFKLHPDYFRTSIVGDWPQGKSIFTACLVELHIINRIAAAIGRPSLFKEDFSKAGERKPRNFAFLIRPTLKEFNEFVHTLDKLISENINRDFFKNDIAFEIETSRDDGKIVVQQKGTLQILGEWLTSVNGPASKDSGEVIDVFRRVRRLRQRPAHALDEDVFDQKYVKEQRALMVDAYRALKMLQEALETHPLIGHNKIDVPTWMLQGRVWTM